MQRLRAFWQFLLLLIFKRTSLAPAVGSAILVTGESTVTGAGDVVSLLPPVYVLPPHRREKWVKPKPSPQPPSPVRTVLHKEPRPPRPKAERIQLTDDPEQWGQFYFRDTILDQLDRYWLYLRRMKYGDRDAYELLHQVGIQMVPWSATRGFDKWREDSESVELSPWWREQRPGFGAIGYGFDDVSELTDHTLVADGAVDKYERSPHWDEVDQRLKAEGSLGKRPMWLGKSSVRFDKAVMDKPATMWTPRFLYFQKYNKPPPEFEHVTGGDVYGMTVYWDRADKSVPKQWRAKNKGGSAQEYGVMIEHATGRVRVLRIKLHERVEIKWAKGPFGGKCTEPTIFTNTHWDVPDRYMRWAQRDRSNIEPEDYLRRLFIEAANMYEAASLGSMVRIAVSKGDLVATFGVEIKRMSHFFKDRDVVLTVRGARRPVLHIVRPYVRRDGTPVRMHFNGMKKFDWAGYHVSVTVPGHDHFHLTDWDMGMDVFPGKTTPRGYIGQQAVGKKLVDMVKKGAGAHKR